MKQWHAHLLRTEAIVFLLGLAIFTEVAFLLAVFVVLPQSGFLAFITPSVLIQSANGARQKTHERTLIINPVLEKAAQLKANDMATKGYFAHTSPSGVTPWHWLDQVGYRYRTAGENLAVDFIDSSDVHQAWMNSPGHRANILNTAYTEIGIATATGRYQGHETIFVVQFFGKPVATAAKLRRSGIAAPVLTGMLAAPRRFSNYGFAAIAILIALAFALTVIIRMELPHPQKAILPMATIAIIISFILINHKIALAGLSIL